MGVDGVAAKIYPRYVLRFKSGARVVPALVGIFCLTLRHPAKNALEYCREAGIPSISARWKEKSGSI